MTKLLSNIIKWNCINFEENGLHVINSNQTNKENIHFSGDDNSRVIAGVHIASPQEIADNFIKKEDKSSKAAEFVDGMNVVNYDKIMEKERERIALEADSLISNAKEIAKAKIDEANSLAEDIKGNAFEEGKREGFEAGLLEGQEELLKKEAEIRKSEEDIIVRKNELEDEYQRKIVSLEPFFAELTISLLGKITGICVENKKDIILHLIKNGLDDIGKSKRYFIHVSSEDWTVVNEARDKIASSLPIDTSIEIIEDKDLTINQCFIETDTKMIDSSLDTQLRNLIEDLKLLSSSK